MVALLVVLGLPAVGVADAAASPLAEEPRSATSWAFARSHENHASAASGAAPHELFVEIIETAYRLLAAYAEGPETSISFSLSDFETLPRERFDEVLYREVTSPPEGRVIDITPSRVGVPGTEIRHARYIARWSPRERSLSDFPEGVRMLTLTLAEVLDEITAANDPKFRDVYAVTRYKVVARLSGEQREYVAAFFWREADGTDGDGWRFYVADHIIPQGVAEAAVEGLPTATEARALRAAEAEGLDEEPQR
jgi:hypothetical protein